MINGKINILTTFRYKQLVPITFLTGFYVSEVVRRYWDQFMSLPFPDNLALKLVTYVHGKVYKHQILAYFFS